MATAGCENLAVPSEFSLDDTGDYRCEIPTMESGYFRLKGAFDRFVGLLLLIPALPLLGLIVLLVRATSKGPGIYSQARVGKGGKVFTMYKIRSMRCDAECKTGPTWAGVARDPRVTPLGYWLRVFHLDELPQIFNVLCGHMSLVGPRPERPEFVSVLAEQIPGYLDRLSVAPGITGLAQINLPADTDLDSVRRKLILDCEYIRTSGFFFDLRIMACTALRMFGIRGGRAVWILGLERKVELPEHETTVDGRASGGPTPLHHVIAPITDDLVSKGPGRSEVNLVDGNGHSPNHGNGYAEPQALRDTVTYATDTVIEPGDDRPAELPTNGRIRVKAK